MKKPKIALKQIPLTLVPDPKVKGPTTAATVGKFYDPARDGVTFSLLTKFKNCRERCRLHLQGWTPKGMGLSIIFGTIAHALLQHASLDMVSGKLSGMPTEAYVKAKLAELEQMWRQENPHAGAESLTNLELTLLVCEAILPLYFLHWNKDIRKLKWKDVEKSFRIPFEVETRRHGVLKTFIRGKMDATFVRAGSKRVSLFETKTKSRVDPQTLVDLLPQELQVGMYLIAIQKMEKHLPESLIYNIVRRPGLIQKKKETTRQFAERIVADIKSRPDWYFIRLNMDVETSDLDRHDMELEDLVSDFLLWWSGEIGHYKNSDHCENKYGRCEFLGTLCRTGQRNTRNFFKRPRVFSELEEV